MTEAERQRKIKRLKKQAKFVRRLQLVLYFPLLIGYSLSKSVKYHFGDFAGDCFLVSLYAAGFTAMGFQLGLKRKLKRQEWQEIGLLLEIYEISRLKEQTRRWVPLIKAEFWKMDAGHRPSLDSLQQRQVTDFLSHDDREMVLASLNGLQWVGDETAVPKIEVLAKGNGKAWKDTEVQQAAIESLSVLRERLEEKKRSGALLRPSSAPFEASLLRPVNTTAPEEATTLLRATNGLDEVH